MLPARKVYKKASTSAGRLTALSHKSEDFGGHGISVTFERTASQLYSPACCISLDGVRPVVVVELLRQRYRLSGQLNL